GFFDVGRMTHQTVGKSISGQTLWLLLSGNSGRWERIKDSIRLNMAASDPKLPLESPTECVRKSRIEDSERAAIARIVFSNTFKSWFGPVVDTGQRRVTSFCVSIQTVESTSGLETCDEPSVLIWT